MNTRSTPIKYKVLSSYYPSLFSLSGGLHVYMLESLTHDVLPYLPPPTVGTSILFIAGASAETNVYQVKAKTAAPIWASTTLAVILYKPNDAVLFSASPDGSKWITKNRTGIFRS